MSGIEARARQIVAEVLSVDPGTITAEAHFFRDLGADGLDMCEISVWFEKEFRVELADERSEEIDTFGKAVRLLEELTGEAA